MHVMPGVIIYNSEYEGIREFLTNEQKGELLDALMDFGCYGEFYKGKDRMIQMAFGMLSATVRREQDKYDATCKRNAEKARKRWEEQKKNAENAAAYRGIPGMQR